MTLLPLAIFVILFQVSTTAFVHPGVFVSKSQLDFIKEQVSKQSQPIYGAYEKAVKSSFANLNYRIRGPPSGGIIECGSYSNPNIGCSDADSDAAAAMTQALLWYITGNKQYAENSIRIMNAYSKNLKGYSNSNAPLQAGWDTEKWPIAAEIIRHTDAGWSTADVQAFQRMLTNVSLSYIYKGSGSNGNWELSMIDGMIGIAVFNDDQDLFNHAVTFWKERVPAYFYIHTDGSKPVPAPRGSTNWNGQTVFNSSVDGVCQETCRDFGHTEYGIASATHVAETAYIQGVNLYELEQKRLVATLEFHAEYLGGNPVPKDVCGGKVELVDHPTFEVGYNAYHNRLGVAMPKTLNWLNKSVRTLSNPIDDHMMVYETLTHGGSPNTE